MEADIFKGESSRNIGEFVISDIITVSNFYFRLYDFVDTCGSHTGAGKKNGDHRQHEERHDDEHRVGDESDHVADLKISEVDTFGSLPHDKNGNTVHDEHHDGHHECHNTVCKELRFHQIAIGLIEPFFFIRFSAECPDNRKTGENLT